MGAYPISLHLALLTESLRVQAIAPALLVMGALWPALIKRNRRAWCAFALALSALGLIYLAGQIATLTLLPPIIFPALLLFVFGRSLIRAREPLITYIGERSRGPLTQAMRHYTRRLTQLWCAIFTALIIQALWLALHPDPRVWSWWTNVINYLAMGGFFVGEYAYRKYRFPEHNHPSFIEYLRIIASHPPPSYNRPSA